MTRNDDQIHPASPTRRKQAHRDGDRVKSIEFATAIQMLGVMLVGWLMFESLAGNLKSATVSIWTQPTTTFAGNQADITARLSGLLFSFLTALAPIGMMLVAVAIASHWLQTGPILQTRNLTSGISRASRGNWTTRLFSLRTLAMPLIGVPKALLTMGVLGVCSYIHRESFFELATYPADEMVQRLFSLILLVCTYVAATMLVVSILDYGIAWFSHESRIQMTEQELRDEQKMESGNTLVSTRRKQRADEFRDQLN